jgi:hypothetical protein
VVLVKTLYHFTGPRDASGLQSRHNIYGQLYYPPVRVPSNPSQGVLSGFQARAGGSEDSDPRPPPIPLPKG